MKPITYLNGILTVLAVLLTLNLWTQWHAGPGAAQLPGLAQQAHARDVPAPASGGAQRKVMIDELKRIKGDTQQISQLLSSGKLRVLVEMPDKK